MPKGKPSSEAKPATTPQPNPIAVGTPPTPPAGPQGPLSGVWQSTMGAQFRIDDDEKAIKIKLVFSDALVSLTGQLVRSDDNPNVLSGPLDAVLRVDPIRHNRVSATATIDGDELRLTCTKWPMWNKQGKYIGHKPTPMGEIFTRSETRVASPERPENPSASPPAF